MNIADRPTFLVGSIGEQATIVTSAGVGFTGILHDIDAIGVTLRTGPSSYSTVNWAAIVAIVTGEPTRKIVPARSH